MTAADNYDSWVLEVLGADPANYAGADAQAADAAAPSPGDSAAPGDGTTPASVSPGGPVPVGPDKVPQMDALWEESLKKGDWQTAAEVVNGFSPQDLKARLAKLKPDQVAKVHQGAIDNKRVGQNSAVALATTVMVHPVVGPAQGDRAKAIESELKPEDAKAYHALLDGAKSDKEKQYLTKGLAAGHSVEDLKKFAAKIAGKDDAWMQDNLSMTGNTSGKGVKQQWSMSCNATAQEAVRGEMDPIWALQMHEENPKLTEADDKDGSKDNPKLAAEQKSLLESSNPDGSAGGQAVSRGSGTPARGRWNTDLLNNVKDTTGVSYDNKKIGTDVTLDKGLTDINDGLAKGMPVPIVIGDGGKNAFAHYVVITATDPGPPRYYTIHDPASGNTVIRSEDQIRKGNIDLGWTKLSAIEAPTEVKKTK